MTNNQRSNFIGTIFTLYRNNFGLFWRIMIPVAIIAISLHIAVFFRSVNLTEKHVEDEPDYTATALLNTIHVNTIDGIIPKVSIPRPDFFGTLGYFILNRGQDTKPFPSVMWRFFPVPVVGTISNDRKSTWGWTLNFQTYDYYSPLILMLLTLCPLSLVVARLSSDVPPDSIPLTAREAWWQTGKKTFTVLVAAVLFVLIVDVGNYIQIGVRWLIPFFWFWLISFLLMRPWLVTLIMILTILANIYLLVTLSLYNPCLILENRSIIGVFKRSHSLVSRTRLRFLWIYLLTGWIAAVITSVLLGAVLLLFSVFFSELAPIREALTPLKFLSLFVGGNVGVKLPNLPSILPTILLLIVRDLILVFLVPVWAIVTTRLYLERVETNAE